MSTWDLRRRPAGSRSRTTRCEGLLANVSSDFERKSTLIACAGGGEEGIGEDVIYDAEDHEIAAGRGADARPRGPLHARRRSASGSARSTCSPSRRSARSRGATAAGRYESAALDLALRQAGTPLHEALGREPRPVTLRRLAAARRAADARAAASAGWTRYPTLRFKLDPTSSWDEALIAELVDTGAVDSVDFKGLYSGTVVDQPPDPVLYRRVVEAFPDAWIEDPAADRRRPTQVLAAHRDRFTWDAPIHSIDDIEALPYPAAHGQHQAVADRRPAQPARRLRLLRRARHRRLRRRPVRARRRAAGRSSTSPRCSTPTPPTTSRRPATTSPPRPRACLRARWRPRRRRRASAGASRRARSHAASRPRASPGPCAAGRGAQLRGPRYVLEV